MSGPRMLFVVSIFGAMLFGATSAQATTERFAIVIGNNLGHHPKRPLQFAEADARKFAQALMEVGGFRPERVKLLLGQNATQAWKTIRSVAGHARRASTKPTTRALLLVYYSGHADGDALELGSSSLQFRELAKFLRKPGISVRLAFVDSCRSGSLVAMKGGRRGPAYTINVNEDMRASGYAIVTSSAADELSQEAKEIRGSFFSHYLVSGLRGAADESGDGEVTLSEVYRYAYSRTVARTTSSIGGAQHPMYQFKLAGQGELLLSRPARLQSYLSMRANEAGRFVVLDGAGERVVAERDASPRREVRLSLAAGKYVVYFLGSNEIGRSQVSLSQGQAVLLKPAAFRKYHPTMAIPKGGLFAGSTRAWTHALAGGFLLRRAALQSGDVTLGAALTYQLQSPSGWAPFVRLLWSTDPNVDAASYQDFGLHFGANYAWTLRWLRPSLGASAGYEHLFQDNAGVSEDTSAFAYQLNLSLEISLTPTGFMQLRVGGGGRAFQILGEGWVHRPDYQIGLNVGWKWSR
ncbi:MAG: caspase family protein [Deltaproteobacteria bacterium]|nr:caspase family protein [Deltaproteobacteria bacterium]